MERSCLENHIYMHIDFCYVYLYSNIRPRYTYHEYENRIELVIPTKPASAEKILKLGQEHSVIRYIMRITVKRAAIKLLKPARIRSRAMLQLGQKSGRN